MSRPGAWGRFAAGRTNRLGLWAVGALLALALGADLLASDQPLLARVEGRLYVLPGLTRPAALRPYDNVRLRASLGEGDWMVSPPIPWGRNSHDLEAVLAPPSRRHWLGTDRAGRDVLARLLHGTRVSLLVGAVAVCMLVAIGVLLGSLAGWFGGWVDALVLRVMEVFLSLPTFLVVITVLAVLSPTGWWALAAIMAAIGLTRWPDVARLVRGEILRLRALQFVEAARALGGSDLHVLWRHVLPNAMSPVLVAATFSVASAILIEGALSFLGFGIPPDMASWGSILSEARGSTQAWWLAVFPGLAIFVTVTAYNIVGEGLRDALDPRLEP